MRLRVQRGFTLMETLLAITLFVVVSASSMGIFSMGLQVWKRTRTDSKTEQRVLLALEKMGQDLRGMVRIAAQSEKFSISQNASTVEYSGASNRIQIPSAYAPGEHPEMGGYGRTTYEWNSSAQTLCRRTENGADLYAPDRALQCRVLAENVASFKLRYWLPSGLEDSYSWYDSWDSKDALPLAVEIQLELKPETRHAGRKNYKKTVVIPVGGKYDPEV